MGHETPGTATARPQARHAAAPIRYGVDLTAHRQHLVHVRMEVPGDLAPGARIVLPVWTPGSYVVRDYARHVQRIDATDADGQPVPVTPDGHTAWHLPDDVTGPVWVRLELYGNELTVRTNHVDDHHALLIPPATLPYVDGAHDRSHRVALTPPEGWRVWTLLPERDGEAVAADYDHLVDSAFEAGDHEEHRFEVAGVPHRFVWAGHAGRPDLDRIVSDATAIGEAAVELFGGHHPSERYTFLCTAWDQGGGGLEHRDGAVLAFPVHRFHTADGYDRFQTLIAHEYVHLWNVKRMVPAALVDLDYERPVHTPSLWVAEGWTAYYDEVVPVRAGVREPTRLLKSAAEQVQRVLDRPGRQLQSVRRASHEAWTKFYVRDENSPNVGVSYYEHGAVLAWCLDLLIREQRPDGDGLDDALRLLWKRYGGVAAGYEEVDVERAVAEVAGTDLAPFFTDHVEGTVAPPIADLVGTVGLRFRDADDDDPAPPDLGVETSEDDDGITFASVLRGRPAWAGGLSGGDRLVAIDGTRVGRGQLDAALRGFDAGDTVEIAVFRGPRLVTSDVQLGAPRPRRELVPVDEPTAAQRSAFRRWCGRDLDDVDGHGDTDDGD